MLDVSVGVADVAGVSSDLGFEESDALLEVKVLHLAENVGGG